MIDGRSLTRDALVQLRLQIVDWRLAGMPVMQIVQASGLSHTAVNAALKAFAAGGEQALVPKARGRKAGTGGSLTTEQTAELRRLIRSRRPSHYGLRDSLWSHRTAGSLIEQQFGVQLSDRMVSKTLNAMGIVFTGRASAQCDGSVKLRLQSCEPEPRELARQINAETFWMRCPVGLDPALWDDEGLTRPPSREQRLLDHAGEVGAGAAEIGNADEADQGRQQAEVPMKKRWLTAASNNQGRTLWAIYSGSFTPERQIKFVEALVRDSQKPVVILVKHKLAAFESQQFLAWLTMQNGKVVVLP